MKRCASHRFLAIRRAEKEGFLKVSLGIEDQVAIERLNEFFLRQYTSCRDHVEQAVKDGYKRLLAPSIETEFLQEYKEKADAEAIRVFGENLRQLLLSPPLGQKRVLAIDPGFQSGCKVVCLDEQGKPAAHENIFLIPRSVRCAKLQKNYHRWLKLTKSKS